MAGSWAEMKCSPELQEARGPVTVSESQVGGKGKGKGVWKSFAQSPLAPILDFCASSASLAWNTNMHIIGSIPNYLAGCVLNHTHYVNSVAFKINIKVGDHGPEQDPSIYNTRFSKLNYAKGFW